MTQETQPGLCNSLEGDGMEGGMEIQEGRDIGVPVADSC